jgi:hypothetical protein
LYPSSNFVVGWIAKLDCLLAMTALWELNPGIFSKSINGQHCKEVPKEIYKKIIL